VSPWRSMVGVRFRDVGPLQVDILEPASLTSWERPGEAEYVYLLSHGIVHMHV
jgi:hypothetical protein